MNKLIKQKIDEICRNVVEAGDKKSIREAIEKAFENTTLKEKRLIITYEAPEVDEALDKALERAINELCKGWEFIGSGYNFQTQTRDIEFRAIRDFK